MKSQYKLLLMMILAGMVLVSGCNLTQYSKNESIYQKHKNFARFELPQNDNECNNDSECFVGGCNGETCTAHEPKITICDVPRGMRGGLSCECINKVCIWVKNG